VTQSTSATVVVFTATPSPPAEVSVWPAIVAGALILAAASGLAWWRGKRRGHRRPSRLVRIFAASVAGGGSGMAMTAMSHPVAAAADGVNPYAPSPELVMLAHILSYLLLAVMLVGTGDLLFDAARPSRSRFWLTLGASLFAVFLIATFSLTGWVDPFAMPPGIEQGALAVSALAAALIWWAWLPLPHHEMADIFE